MITEEEQKLLKALFKGRYTQSVLKILNDRGVLNRNGDPHNAQYVRMVFQMIRKNSDIEAAIWKLAAIRKQTINSQEILKRQILNNIP